MKYAISNESSGHCLGVYEANSDDEAVEAMAREAGYASYRDACAVDVDEDQDLDAEVEYKRSRLIVQSIDDMFDELVDNAMESAIAYDADEPVLIIVNDTYRGEEKIKAFLADKQYDLTREQIEDAYNTRKWDEEVWWYALTVAARNKVALA